MPTLSEMEMSDDDSLVIEEEGHPPSSSRDKRPRGAGEEKEKDESGPSATTTAKEGEPEVELLKTKRVRRLKPFTEALLTGPYGLSRIYDEFPLKLRYNGSKKGSGGGKEEKYLEQLFALYKEWAFQLHPGLSFQDVLLKCDTLGSRGAVRACVQNLRDRERERYTNEVLLPIHIDRVAEEALARAAAPPRSTRSRHGRQDSGQSAIQEGKRERDNDKEEEEEEEMDERQDPQSGEQLITRLEYESAEEEEELPPKNVMEDSNQNQKQHQPEEEQHVEEEANKEEEETALSS